MNVSTELLIEIARVLSDKDKHALALEARVRALVDGIAECAERQGIGGCRAHKFLTSLIAAPPLPRSTDPRMTAPLTEGELRHLLEDEHGSATFQIGRLAHEVLRLRERIAVLDHDGGQTDEVKKQEACTGHLVHHEYTPCPIHDR
jgi:hypothetical protein